MNLVDITSKRERLANSMARATMLPPNFIDTHARTHLIVKHNSAGEVSVSLPPPPNFKRTAPLVNKGIRRTKCLSHRGVKSVRGAAFIAHQEHGGMKTFITATFCAEARERLVTGETTIGAEMRRFIDAWRSRYRKQGKAIPLFIWVAENPNNSNPHVHILTNAKVPYSQFTGWAHGLEKLWGNGFLHLEKIRHPASAGHYLLKVIKHTRQNTNQGEVVGQRYGISTALRPKEFVNHLQVGVVGVLAFKKLLTQTHVKTNSIYIHEFGIWTPPGFGYYKLKRWLLLELLQIINESKLYSDKTRVLYSQHS